MQVFAILKKGGLKINADVNVNNWLTEDYVIKDFFRIVVIAITSAINHDNFWRIFRLLKDLFGILVIVIVSVINHVILENS